MWRATIASTGITEPGTGLSPTIHPVVSYPFIWAVLHLLGKMPHPYKPRIRTKQDAYHDEPRISIKPEIDQIPEKGA